MTTAKDVAVSLGLSVSTVGRALSDDPRISAETKARVVRAAEAMGYVANRAARMMRGASSDIVGVVVPDISNGFYATIAHALSETLARNRYQLMLGETADDPTAELRQVRGFVAAQVAGAIVVPTAQPAPATVRLLGTLPHVQLLRRSALLGPQWFGIDDEQCLRTATEHLTGLGHRRIAFVGGTADLPTGAARLLDRADPPTGIVTASVQATRGVLEALLERGTDVPGEVSVVGFGDEAGWSWWGPGLTTISLPVQQLATACALWLLDRLGNPAPEPAPFASTSPGALTVRGSTAPPTRS